MNDVSFVGRHFKTHSVSFHSHDEWELIYFFGGRGEMIFEDGESLKYDKGDVFAVPPGVKHTYRGEEGVSTIYLTVSDATMPYRSVKKIADKAEKQLLCAFSEAYYYFNSDVENKELVLTALGSLIVSYFIVYVGKTDTSEVVEEIKKSILKNFSDPSYTLDNYLKTFPFSYDYLRKLFKKETGVTPHEYLTRMRMNAAQMLLSGANRSAHSVNEISEMCGFLNPLYFSRLFKKRFGSSPRHYSKNASVKTKELGDLT